MNERVRAGYPDQISANETVIAFMFHIIHCQHVFRDTSDIIDNHFYFLLLIDSISLLKNLINLQNDNQQLMGIMSEVKSIWQIISQ